MKTTYTTEHQRRPTLAVDAAQALDRAVAAPRNAGRISGNDRSTRGTLSAHRTAASPFARSLARGAARSVFGATALLGVASTAAAADFDCVIQPRQILEIRSPIEGLIERITVDRGSSVRKGQEIALIDTSVERALAEGAKFRSQMDGAIRAGESRVHFSKRKFARAKELARKDFIPAQQHDDALNERLIAESELVEAEDNRKLAEIEYRRQMAIIQLKTIRSPINGVVMERVLNAGEVTETGVGRRPIMKLAQTDVLNVEALLPADLYRQVKVGLSAIVTPAVVGGAPTRAKVVVLDRVLDPASGTFGVRLELPNPTGDILAGVRCRLAFEGIDATRVAPRPVAAPPAAPRPAVPVAAPRPQAVAPAAKPR